jgi:hypothetical protein
MASNPHHSQKWIKKKNVKFELKRKKIQFGQKINLERSLNFERAPLILQRELKKKKKQKKNRGSLIFWGKSLGNL